MGSSSDERPLGEFELIDRYFTRSCAAAARPDVVLGIGDDAAVLRLPENTDLVAAVDTLVEGRHFPHGSTPRSIGHRALAVNLSDLAAMGARPRWATLALTLPRADAAWLEEFSAGLDRLAEAYGVALVGGDTTAGPMTISLQLLGHVERDGVLRRSGARAGDVLAVTGTLGDAGAGLRLLTGDLVARDTAIAAELIERFEYPRPAWRSERARAASPARRWTYPTDWPGIYPSSVQQAASRHAWTWRGCRCRARCRPRCRRPRPATSHSRPGTTTNSWLRCSPGGSTNWRRSRAN